jgi:hypothetical protein
MKNAAVFVLAATLLTACASTDDEPRGRRPMPTAATTPQGGGLGLLPPANWWHDPQISSAVKLSDAQFTSLDAMGKEHAADMDRLRMDLTAGERDLRLVLAAEQPASSDILTAGRRVSSLRDQLLDHEVRMLADERVLLTHDQWTTLQAQLRDERGDDVGRRGGYGRGVGRRGGGGRRPGF